MGCPGFKFKRKLTLTEVGDREGSLINKADNINYPVIAICEGACSRNNNKMSLLMPFNELWLGIDAFAFSCQCEWAGSGTRRLSGYCARAAIGVYVRTAVRLPCTRRSQEM
jgi:hypothetical protein